MTLLITVLAAIATSTIWVFKDMQNEKRLGTLSLIYWGASIMWFVDAVAEYIKVGASYFTPTAEEMLNDAFLGVSEVALGLIIWLIMVVVRRVRTCT